jgi:hypothetical protein
MSETWKTDAELAKERDEQAAREANKAKRNEKDKTVKERGK